MGLLEGKVAIITGAGTGIGRAHALLFAREGAAVVVNDLGGTLDGVGSDKSAAQAVVDEILTEGGKSCANGADVADPKAVDELFRTTIQSFGRLDIVVNNAGILRDKTLHKMDTKMWDSVIRVHLRGTFLCMRAAARHFRSREGGGRIINTTSVSGLLGNFGQANYAAAKAGIYGLTRTGAIELKKVGVTVNALAPIALTRMTAELPMMSAMKDASALLAPSLVAPAALFLASDLSADITGVVVGIEGKRLFTYQMTQTEAILPAGEAWTADEIRARWAEISGTESL